MRNRILATLAVSVLSTTACGESSFAFGDVNSIIVAADPLVWAGIENEVVSRLEQTVFTVRNEKTFKITYQNPYDQHWGRLKLFKQELLIGSPEDPWMVEALAQVEDSLSLPQIIQTGDVWAKGQTITMLVLPDTADLDDIRPFIPHLAELFQSQYRTWVVNKMFASGRDTVLARKLREQAGFEILVPQVYVDSVADSVYLFRNDNPDPGELIRQVAVTWRSPIPDGISPEEMLDWRAQIVEDHYDFPQVLDSSRHITSAGPVDGKPTFNLQGVWLNPPETWPAAGPFKTRAVMCRDQDRLYLVDTWLYAPGKEKFEYMIQLGEIMDSFDCAQSG